MGTTRYPACLRKKEIDAEVRPLPMPEITPPDIKIYFVLFLIVLVLWGTINVTKPRYFRQLAVCINFNPEYEQSLLLLFYLRSVFLFLFFHGFLILDRMNRRSQHSDRAIWM